MITKYKIFEERYLSDEEIEAGYKNYKITEFSVDRIRDDGGASGSIEIFYIDEDADGGGNTNFDSWIKYDSGPRIAFDSWYPDQLNIELKEYIEIGILIKKKYPNITNKELREYIEEELETNKFNI